MQLKSFCTAKETIHKTKRPPFEWKNIFAKEATERIHLQNLQAAHAAQYQKNKQPNPILSGRPK